MNPIITIGFFIVHFLASCPNPCQVSNLRCRAKKGTRIENPLAQQLKFYKMKVKEKSNIYNQAQRFADVTKALIINGKIQRAKRCLQMAESIFNNGTSEIKNVITNVYLFSVSSFMEVHHCSIRGLLPKKLQNEYYKQVNTSGL